MIWYTFKDLELDQETWLCRTHLEDKWRQVRVNTVGPYHQKQYKSLVKRMKSKIRSKDPFQDLVSIINGGII